MKKVNKPSHHHKAAAQRRGEPQLLRDILHLYATRCNEPLARLLRDMLGSAPDSTPLEEWITIDVACDLLNISERTFQYWREKYRIPYSKVENRCYFRRSDIEAILQRNFHPNRKEDSHE